MTLKEIRLPEGNVGSINIGWSSNGASINLRPEDWLAEGHTGVRIIGAGVDRTHVRCTSWDGNTIVARRHKGTVQFEGFTLWAGYSRGLFFGEQNLGRTITRGFECVMRGVKGNVLPPAPGMGRTKWLLFGYQSDLVLEDVELDATHASEHASYWHGSAGRGWRLKRVTFHGSGAEGFKVRSDATETAWAGRVVWVIIQDSTFKNWYQTWSDRGGAAIVLQGAAANVLLERNVFYGGGELGSLPSNVRSKAIMVSSEPNSYDIETGKVGTGFGNGDVTVRNCAARGRAEDFWHNTLLRCAPNGTSQKSARSLTVDGCGFYGKQMILEMSAIPAGKTIVRASNTPEIRRICNTAGFDTSIEATIPTRDRLIPVSEGYQA